MNYDRMPLMKCIIKFIVLIFGFIAMPANGLILENLIQQNKLSSTFKNKKIGYYFGSFDPLHIGHEAIVNDVLKQGLCDFILIYPAWGGDIYKKRTNVFIRLEMLFETFKNHPKVIVTQLNPGALQQILMEDQNNIFTAGKQTVKSRIAGVEYIGIIGSDAALDIVGDQEKLLVFMRGIKLSEKHKENTIGGILALPIDRFIVNIRPGDSLQTLQGKIADRPIFATIMANSFDISSTKIRTLLKSKNSIDDFINKEVIDIIIRNKLYCEDNPKN